MITFEEACKQLNIPSDRVGLVKRNIELKQKLNSALMSMDEIRKAIHDEHSHDSSYDECTKTTCSFIRNLIEIHRAS